MLMECEREDTDVEDEDENDIFAFRHAGDLQYTFILWDSVVRGGFTMGCCPITDESVFVVLRHKGSDNSMRCWKGEAWTSDATYPARDRRISSVSEVKAFCSKIQASSTLSVVLVFDGQMNVETGFGLHMHFDQAIEGRSLLVKNVAVGTNPLLVIDSFS
jgi:hypothetical protein